MTKPFIFSGSELHINFSTSAAGALRFELQSLDVQPLPGFSLDECQEQIGNEIDRTVSWKNSTGVRSLARTPGRPRLLLQDHHLHRSRFTPPRSAKTPPPAPTTTPSTHPPIA